MFRGLLKPYMFYRTPEVEKFRRIQVILLAAALLALTSSQWLRGRVMTLRVCVVQSIAWPNTAGRSFWLVTSEVACRTMGMLFLLVWTIPRALVCQTCRYRKGQGGIPIVNVHLVYLVKQIFLLHQVDDGLHAILVILAHADVDAAIYCASGLSDKQSL